jgi:hypothetical protein
VRQLGQQQRLPLDPGFHDQFPHCSFGCKPAQLVFLEPLLLHCDADKSMVEEESVIGGDLLVSSPAMQRVVP